MKSFFSILILAAIFAAWYYTPYKHHQAAAGIHFLRDYCTVSTPIGITGWTPGQQVREDLRAPVTPGSRTVTDGVISAVIPESALTKDVEDAEALRAADAQEQAQNKANIAAINERIAQRDFNAQLAAAKNLDRHNAATVAASTIGNYASALNRPGRGVTGGAAVYYGYPYYVGSSVGSTGSANPGNAGMSGVSAGIAQVNRNQAASESASRNRPPVAPTPPPTRQAW